MSGKKVGGPGEDSNLHLRILPAVFLGYTTGPLRLRELKPGIRRNSAVDARFGPSTVLETHCSKKTLRRVIADLIPWTQGAQQLQQSGLRDGLSEGHDFSRAVNRCKHVRL